MAPQSLSTKAGRRSLDRNLGGGKSSLPRPSLSVDRDIASDVRQAAIQVADDFDLCSSLRNDALAKLVAAFDPSELDLGTCLSSPAFSSSSKCKRGDNRFLWYRLRKIELKDPDDDDNSQFDDQMQDNRERVADWCEGDHHFSVKFVNTAIFEKGSEAAKEAAAALVSEAKTLANLPKHPHIVQVHGMHYLGPSAGFAGQIQTASYFTIVDEISDTLQQRISAWRKRKQAYETDRFDDMEPQQAEITQRLEVVVDTVSALEWLGTQNLVFMFNPTKAGFDSRMDRVKLFDFGHSVESGKVPLVGFDRTKDDFQKAYMAPAALRGKKIALDTDVYAIGILLWEVIHLKPPFHSMTSDQYWKEVVEGGKRPSLSRDLPSCIRNLMQDCWSSDKLLSMKDVHDRLEEMLLEGMDFQLKPKKSPKRSKSSKQINCEQDQEEKNVVRGSRSRKIKYQKCEENTGDIEESDVKSTRSKQTSGSHSTRRSKESRSSRGTMDSKKYKSPVVRSRKSKQQISESRTPRQDRHISPSLRKIHGGSPPSSRSLKGKKSKSNRKMQFSKEQQSGRDKGSRSPRSRESRKERGQPKKSPSSRGSIAPKRPKSLSDIPLLQGEGNRNEDFLESMKKQVASIQRNIAGDCDSSEDKQSLGENQPRGRGVHRRVSSRRLSSRRLQSRSSSRELAPPTNKSQNTSPSRSRRSLSRGVSTERLHLTMRPTRLSRSSSRESLQGMSKTPAKRRVRKSASGLDAAMIGSLGDPSRSAPVRSKSTTFANSPPSKQGFKSPSLLRRKSHDDAIGFDGSTAARDQLLSQGHDSSGDEDNFIVLSLASDERRQGIFQATPSGGLIQASSKDVAGTHRARAAISQMGKERSSRSIKRTAPRLERKLSRSQRQISRRAVLEAQ